MSCSGLYFAFRSRILINRTMCPPCVLPVRTKVYIKNKYEEPTYDRKLLLAACEPVQSRDKRPSWERCRKTESERERQQHMYPNFVHPYDKLLGERLKQDMLSSHLIAFYHLNQIPYEFFTKLKNQLQHKNLWLNKYNRIVYEIAIENTKFANIRPQLCAQRNTVILVAKGDANIQTMLQMDKKMSGFLLMFAFVEDRLVRKDELLAYSQLGSLDEVRAQLCATLNHGLASLPAHIAQPTTLLSLVLDQYVQREQQQQDRPPRHASGEPTLQPGSPPDKE